MRRSSHHFGLLEGHGREVEPVLHLSEVLLDQALDARPHRDLRTAPKDFRRNLVVLVQGLWGYALLKRLSDFMKGFRSGSKKAV